MLDKIQVGAISSTHGLKGEVYVYPTTDDVGRFEDLSRVLISRGGEYISFDVEYVKFFKGRPIVKFKGLDRIEDVERLKGTPLWVPREEALPLEEGEYFIGDLIGCVVYLEDGSRLGVLDDVMQTGANDVYVVKKDEGGEVLIPVTYECVLAIEPERERIVVHLLPEI